MKFVKLAGVILAASLYQGASATTAESEVLIDALDEQQLSEELPYLEALLAGEDLMSEGTDAEAFRHDRRRDRRDRRWRRPAPRRTACFARNIRTGVVYRAVGWGNNRGLQRAAVRACRSRTPFDRLCRPLGCRRFR